MSRIRVGILGCAEIAVRSLAPAFKQHSSFDLVSFAGRDPEKTFTIANSFGCEAMQSYQTMIERKDLDLVYVPLPNSLHKEWVIKALLSGKHVLCEKSLGCSYPEVSEMVETARSQNRLLVENFQFRFHSQHQYVKDLLYNQEIGEIRGFRASFGFPPFQNKENIRYKKSLGGGALLDAGAYTLKAADFIIGNDFEVKAASLNISKSFDVDIFGGIYMVNRQGISAELSFGFDNSYQCNYEIWGSKGKITSQRAFTAPPGYSPTLIIEKQGNKDEIELPPDDHFYNMLTHIETCAKNNNFETENLQNLRQAYYIEQAKVLSNKYFF
jgi:dTDP-3,4-didehydro-2,6-dideoxy-alpha-D-glucose 3-reductase